MADIEFNLFCECADRCVHMFPQEEECTHLLPEGTVKCTHIAA